MPRLSRKTILTLEAVLHIAFNARPDPVQSKDITRRQGIPQRYLEQVMQSLVHNGILKGVRGPRGGYTLARERRKITVGDIVRVVDRLDAETEAEPASKSDLGEKIIAPLWEETRAKALETLDRITMEDLCRRARAEGLGPAAKDAADFTIGSRVRRAAGRGARIARAWTGARRGAIRRRPPTARRDTRSEG